MEVRIGVRDVAREVTLETDQKPEEIEKLVAAALADEGGSLTLTDESGRRVIVPVRSLGYVDIVGQKRGAVGFGGY